MIEELQQSLWSAENDLGLQCTDDFEASYDGWLEPDDRYDD
jgi:hypothetical protein